MKYSFAVLALTSTNAYTTILPPDLHWNEDPHSRPNPLSGEYAEDRTLTTTQARWARNGNTDEELEPAGKNMQFHVPYNYDATVYLQSKEMESDSDSDSESDNESEAVFLRQADTSLV
jgi:hypothetical protein